MSSGRPAILAFDTSSAGCSAALIAGSVLLGEDMRSGSGNYSALLLRLIDRLLGDAGLTASDLDCIAVATGPGSFTGLRVGISTAQGLGLALGKPIVGISTLELLAAQNMPFDGSVCALLDARRSQVYACLFRQGPDDEAVAECNERVVCPREWAVSLRGRVLLCGSGAELYREVFTAACTADYCFAPEENCRPRAAMLARIAAARLAAGRTLAPEQVLACYVRRPEAERAAAMRPLRKD